jgi:hypothetical protein
LPKILRFFGGRKIRLPLCGRAWQKQQFFIGEKGCQAAEYLPHDRLWSCYACLARPGIAGKYVELYVLGGRILFIDENLFKKKASAIQAICQKLRLFF